MRYYKLKISLIPQNKKHTRRVILFFQIEAKNICEARQKVLQKCLDEGFNLLNFKIKELN